jgi:hypothetical protein
MQHILNKYHRWFIVLLFLVYFINGLIYIPRQFITADEGDHLNYAIRFVKGHPEKIKPFDDASAMPVSALNTIPRIAEQMFRPALQKKDCGGSDIVNGRYITLIISLFIGLYVYKWSKDLFGKTAALFSLLLFVFCPNIAAHAGLVTTDVYSALFALVPLYHYWRYTKERSLKQFILFAVALALAQLCKQSLSFLYPLFLLLFIARIIYNRNIKLVYSKTALLNLLLLVAIQLIIINAGFQFKGTGSTLNNYSFRSHFFKNVQEDFSFIGNVPLPFPTPYLEGLDDTKTIDEMGGGHPESSPRIYLLGKTKEGRGFWNYYFVTLFFKTPIPLLLGFFVSLFLFFKKRNAENLWAGIMLLLPVAFFLVYFDFFYNSQVGFRHILMILPLMQVFAGLFFYEIIKKRWGIKLCVAMALYAIASFYYYFPYLIPYTNEFILNKKMAYKIMADSNLDYQQASGLLKKYLEAHPGQYAPEQPAAGEFIISLTDLLELQKDNGYAWLRENYQPSRHLAFTYLIFDVSKESLAEKNLLPK